ncbi:hypothetical protein TNCT_75861 [Trichonephila clavata]|uniref:Uncharacterized protein n=1 Tax=Trichonephila clavata TaxID=2740835 RepID=A0A8X6ILH9_TRICU|nr:hypothetical protein TNCT_75861 [Trichonephila clavata]
MMKWEARCIGPGYCAPFLSDQFRWDWMAFLILRNIKSTCDDILCPLFANSNVLNVGMRFVMHCNDVSYNLQWFYHSFAMDYACYLTLLSPFTFTDHFRREYPLLSDFFLLSFQPLNTQDTVTRENFEDFSFQKSALSARTIFYGLRSHLKLSFFYLYLIFRDDYIVRS